MTLIYRTNIFILFLIAIYSVNKGHCYGLEENRGELYPDVTSDLNGSLNKISFTTPFYEDVKFYNNELRKIFEDSSNLHEQIKKIAAEFQDHHMLLKRHVKELGTLNESGLAVQCISCVAKGTTATDLKCYSAKTASKEKCADAEQCYTEVHPLYIKRGCILPERLNRTFVCKCPLCNDKPSYDSVYYDYKSIKDWDYDNKKRLVAPVIGLDLMCKVCETKGVNKVADMTCKFGKNADYMVCPHNHICFTNIDDESDYVARGCIHLPAFNSMYYFCNSTGCNNIEFLSPAARFRSNLVVGRLKNKPPKNAFSSKGSLRYSFISMTISEIVFTIAKILYDGCE